MGQSEQTGRIITQAPAATWERAIAAVADLDVALLRTAVVDAVDTDTPLYRLAGRDGRDDLDRGQHPPSPTAADIAALSVPRTATIRPPERRPGDDASSAGSLLPPPAPALPADPAARSTSDTAGRCGSTAPAPSRSLKGSWAELNTGSGKVRSCTARGLSSVSAPFPRTPTSLGWSRSCLLYTSPS